MKRKSLTNHLKWLGLVVAALMVLSFKSAFAQCSPNGVTIQITPQTPLQFQFFPISLLGIGGAGANLSAFNNFGVQFSNSTGSAQSVNVKIEFFSGSDAVFEQNLVISLSIPVGTFFIGVPELLNTNIAGGITRLGQPTKPRIKASFIKDLKGGLPSGTFRFDVSAAPFGTPTYAFCGSITAEVLTGSTVDLIIPGNGSTTQSLPQFQWAATGGSKFVLTIAKLKVNQSQEDALGTSSQRVVFNINNVSSYTLTAGGTDAVENNLTWVPGLPGGAYCYRVTMIQEDPVSGSQYKVNSQIANFTVSSGGDNASGINTEELLNLLSGALGGVNIGDKLKGYSALGIEIDGKAATMDDLRAKLGDIKGKTIKVEIKP
jgi:hypothetical protein